MLLTSKVVTSKTKKNHLATFTKVQSISMKHLAEGSFLLKEGFISFYKYLCDKKNLKTRITISCRVIVKCEKGLSVNKLSRNEYGAYFDFYCGNCQE